MPISYNAIGIMSGTSLDGLDMAYCEFRFNKNKWSYVLKKAVTLAYTDLWNKRLRNIENGSALDFSITDVDYGHFIGEQINKFIKKHGLNPDLISSHGHTIFHQPKKKLTVQIGSGAAIAAECGLPVVCDFRTVDVGLGGQGAPLVPVGDELLFSEYDYCLNLGGIANVSYNKGGERTAFDICPVNMALNHLANQTGKKYDDKGKLAQKGKIDKNLLNELNLLDFYQLSPPKSLGKEWFIENFLQLLNKYKIPVEDKLRTVTKHIATQLSSVLKGKGKQVLVTGGGVYNEYLIEETQKLSSANLVVPAPEIIEFKEAMIFAFLGVLRIRNEVNCLKSVTGAKLDNIGGAVYKPF